MRLLRVVIFTGYLLFSLAAESAALSAPSVKLSGMDLIKGAMRRYQKADVVEIQLNKIVTLALLDETKKSIGLLLFSKGKMRLQIEKPEESLIVMNASALWVVTPTPPELGGKTQVVKIKSKELSKQARAPLAALLGKTAAWDQMKIKNETESDGVVTLKLVPKKPELLGDITAVTLVIARKSNVLKVLSYNDELDNVTTYEFKNSNFSAKAKKDTFDYVPPKNAEVTEY